MRRKLIVLLAILGFWLAEAADVTTIAMSPSTPAVNLSNSSANDSSQASPPPPDITSQAPFSSNSSNSSSTTTTTMGSASVVSSLTSSPPSIIMASISDGSSMAASSSSASSAPLPTSQNAPMSSPSATGQPKSTAISSDPTYLPMVAAIISGFGLLVVMIFLLLTMALIYRHLGKKESIMTPVRKAKKGDGIPYSMQQSQSAQYLVSSMSTPSFGNSPSDVRLDSHIPSSPGNMVYYNNRGLDVNERPAGAYDHEDGYKPIQIVAADASGRPTSMSRV